MFGVDESFYFLELFGYTSVVSPVVSEWRDESSVEVFILQDRPFSVDFLEVEGDEVTYSVFEKLFEVLQFDDFELVLADMCVDSHIVRIFLF